MAALKTIRTLDTGALSRADSARIRWLQSTLSAVDAITIGLKRSTLKSPHS